jgi:hypothetical protein
MPVARTRPTDKANFFGNLNQGTKFEGHNMCTAIKLVLNRCLGVAGDFAAALLPIYPDLRDAITSKRCENLNVFHRENWQSRSSFFQWAQLNSPIMFMLSNYLCFVPESDKLELEGLRVEEGT